MYNIYRIKNNLNNETFIGATNLDLNVCLEKHFEKAFSEEGNLLIHKAIRDFGKENFSICKIDHCADERKNLVLGEYVKVELKFNKQCLNRN